MRERVLWSTNGPLVDPHNAGSRHGVTVYSSWEAAMAHYAEHRDEYLAGRRRTPMIERLYQAYVGGEPMDQAKAKLRRQRHDDPRAEGTP